MLTNAMEEMERSVDLAETQISTLNMKLQKFEQAVPQELNQEQESVLELLDSVVRLKICL